jgi:hypothetical protein
MLDSPALSVYDVVLGVGTGAQISTRRNLFSLPKYWGPWFVPVKDSNLKQANLNIFYHLGSSIKDIHEIHAGLGFVELMWALQSPRDWLIAFIKETEGVELPDSRASATSLLDAINRYLHPPIGTNLDSLCSAPR